MSKITDEAVAALHMAGLGVNDLPAAERVAARLEIARGFQRLAAIEKGLLPADMAAEE